MSRIHVHSFYRGRPSDEQPIQPGIYEIDDPALHGAGKYLLANNWAVELDENGAPLTPIVTVTPIPGEPVADPCITLRDLLDATRRNIEAMSPALIENSVPRQYLSDLISVLSAAAQQLFDAPPIEDEEDALEEDAFETSEDTEDTDAQEQFDPSVLVEADAELPAEDIPAAEPDPAAVDAAPEEPPVTPSRRRRGAQS